MAVKIKIKDYQSIKDAEIEVDGFTVVTGPNNSGKSALMRAVSGLFRNAALEEEGSVVRHGEDKFRVEMDFGAEGKVAWEKGPKIKPTYEVDGTTLHPGRDVPDEIKKFGVLPIQAGGRELWPNAAQRRLAEFVSGFVGQGDGRGKNGGRRTRSDCLVERRRRDVEKERHLGDPAHRNIWRHPHRLFRKRQTRTKNVGRPFLPCRPFKDARWPAATDIPRRYVHHGEFVDCVLRCVGHVEATDANSKCRDRRVDSITDRKASVAGGARVRYADGAARGQRELRDLKGCGRHRVRAEAKTGRDNIGYAPHEFLVHDRFVEHRHRAIPRGCHELLDASSRSHEHR